MSLDRDSCYRAVESRDGRFDGVFFMGVTTTGVYCRPVCRARTPRADRCRFFRSGAEAEREGFRACFRCRPELAPGAAPVDAIPRLVTRAVARIEAGALNGGSVDLLAAELGVSGRHLRRAVKDALGVGPVELAQSRRLAMAKALLHDSSLPLGEVALASGFSSVRRFDAVFRARLRRPPSAVRREGRRSSEGAPDLLRLRLEGRLPFDWEAILRFLGARAIPGVEEADELAYRRTLRLVDPPAAGWVEVREEPPAPAPGDRAANRAAIAREDRPAAARYERSSGDRERVASAAAPLAALAFPTLRVTVSPSLAGALMPVVSRLRALLDLDAHPSAIDEHLAKDLLLAPRVRARPGLRVPGTCDGFEAAVRAILGQQVSVRGATTLAGRMAARFGEPVETPFAALTRLSPAPERLAQATEDEVAAIGMPGQRARSLIALARAVASGALSLERPSDVEATIARLLELPGIGPWTAQYLAMRALGWPDAFPAGDLGVRNALGGLSEREAERRAERWRPWRAYAVMHLWSSTPADSSEKRSPTRGLRPSGSATPHR